MQFSREPRQRRRIAACGGGDRGRHEQANGRRNVEPDEQVQHARFADARGPQPAASVVDLRAQRMMVKQRDQAHQVSVDVARERAARAGAAETFVEHARQRTDALAVQRRRAGRWDGGVEHHPRDPLRVLARVHARHARAV